MNKLERRQDLLRAARTVFAEKGYHEAKVDDIVALAKVAKGTFYLYFPDKRSVFAELVQGLFGRLGGAILRVDPEADVEAQIKHNIRAIVAVLLDDAALTSILLSYSAGLDPAFITQVRSFHKEVKRLLVGSLVEGQRLGIVQSGDTKLYATFTIGAMKEVLFENAMGEEVRHREQIVTSLFELLERGYLLTGTGREQPAAVGPRHPAAAPSADGTRAAEPPEEPPAATRRRTAPRPDVAAAQKPRPSAPRPDAPAAQKPRRTAPRDKPRGR